MSQAPPESILIADCGAVATKVGLVDHVGGEYRLIGMTRAATTVEPPSADVSVGVCRAIAQLEGLTGRQLLNDAGDLITPEGVNGEGVDGFTAVTSAALPLRAAVMGLSRDFSVASAQRALAATFVTLEHTLAVDEESGRWGTTARDGRAGGPSASVERLAALRPEIIVMVGGVDGGATPPLLEMANIVASLGAAMEESTRPLVLFAGNREARAQVAERIGALMEFCTMDNVRPTLDAENLTPLRRELETIFYERRVKQIPGLAHLSAWSPQPVVPTVNAYERVAQFLARRYDLRVLALDLGGAAVALLRADAQHSDHALASDLGLGYGLDQLLARVGLERVARWLPPTLALEEAHASLLNQALRPWTTPTRPEDQLALNAAAREVVGAFHETPVLRLSAAAGSNGQPHEADLVLLSGAPVARGSKPAALMLLALDALDVRGIFSIAADASGLAPALGALAAVNPEAAAQVVERDALVTLGTALVPTFSGHFNGGAALQGTIETQKGGTLQVQVAAGALELIPLGVGEKARVEIRPARGVDLHVPLKGGVFKREVEGGTAGFLIDARGRPLPFAPTLEQQRERAQKWLWEVGG
jgi:MutL protein